MNKPKKCVTCDHEVNTPGDYCLECAETYEEADR